MSETLGSYNDYLLENKLEHTQESVNEYFLAISGLRQELAKKHGVDVDELHLYRFDRTTS